MKRIVLTHLLTPLLALSLAMASPATSEERYTLFNGTTVEPLDSFKECDVCPEMVVMPLGSFLMGSTPEESAKLADLYRETQSNFPDHMVDETPKHRVNMNLPYAIGKFEVTREEWMACYNLGRCSHWPTARLPEGFGGEDFDDPRAPIFEISYDDVQQYIRFLNWKIGRDVYRLPTEAEWEYAARGGTDTAYAQGDAITKDQASFSIFEVIDGTSRSVPSLRGNLMIVDDLDAANPWGLWHIAGNLQEMTRSCSTLQHSALSTQVDYLQIDAGASVCRRVLKDGSFNASPEYARPAQRTRVSQDVRRRWIGFRVARDLR